MERAEDIREYKKIKREQKIKENAELVNKELLEFEKAINKYKNDIEDEKHYITLPILIRTEEVKSLLAENGYIIDKVSNDIEVNTTRIWLDKNKYDETTSYDNHINNLRTKYTSRCDDLSGIKKAEEKINNKSSRITGEDWINALIYLGKLQEEYK